MDTPDRSSSDDPATDLERRLLGWKPAPSTNGRDRMMFEAGVAAGQRRASARAAGLAAVLILGAGGWIGTERAARTRLEVALAERTHALEVARAHQPAQPGPARDRPIPPAPASDLVVRYGVRDGMGDPTEPAPGPPGVNLFPTGGGPVLTPRSARRVGDAVEL